MNYKLIEGTFKQKLNLKYEQETKNFENTSPLTFQKLLELVNNTFTSLKEFEFFIFYDDVNILNESIWNNLNLKQDVTLSISKIVQLSFQSLSNSDIKMKSNFEIKIPLWYKSWIQNWLQKKIQIIEKFKNYSIDLKFQEENDSVVKEYGQFQKIDEKKINFISINNMSIIYINNSESDENEIEMNESNKIEEKQLKKNYINFENSEFINLNDFITVNELIRELNIENITTPKLSSSVSIVKDFECIYNDKHENISFGNNFNDFKYNIRKKFNITEDIFLFDIENEKQIDDQYLNNFQNHLTINIFKSVSFHIIAHNDSCIKFKPFDLNCFDGCNKKMFNINFLKNFFDLENFNIYLYQEDVADDSPLLCIDIIRSILKDIYIRFENLKPEFNSKIKNQNQIPRFFDNLIENNINSLLNTKDNKLFFFDINIKFKNNLKVEIKKNLFEILILKFISEKINFEKIFKELEILFNIKKLKAHQELAILEMIKKKNVLVQLPTGI